MSEFAVNSSRLPHRTVADRRRTAQRVQKRFQTVRRGAQGQRLSAAIIGSDHVNFGHGEYTVSGCDSLLFNNLVDGPCLHCVPTFFPSTRSQRRFYLHRLRIPVWFSTFSVVILHGPTVFPGALSHLSLVAVPPKSIINVQAVPLRSPYISIWYPWLDLAVILCNDYSNTLLIILR